MDFIIEDGVLIEWDYYYADTNTTVVVPEGVRVIGEDVFREYNIERVVLPTTLRAIGNYAFAYCSRLKEIVIQSTIEQIGISAFFGCDVLPDDMLPEPLRQTRHFLFDETGTVLEFYDGTESHLVIPQGVVRIASSACHDCDSLESITFPDSLEVIDDYAFSGCQNLTAYVPAHVEVDDDAFEDCRMFVHGGMLVECNRQEAEIILPTGITMLGVEHPRYQAVFQELGTLERIVLPEGLLEINADVFRECTNLREVHLPSTLRSISVNAFQGCTALRHIEFPDSLRIIEDGAFCGCTALEEVILPDSVSEVYAAFCDCTAVKKVRLPGTLKEIHRSFHSCTSLTELILEEGLERIEYGNFDSCTSLETLKLPSTLKSLKNSVFQSCTSLKMIELNEGLVSLDAFRGAPGVAELKLPSTLREFGRTFQGCTTLREFVVPDSVESLWPHAFYGCTALERVVLPTHIKELPRGLFENCVNLREVVMADDVTISYDTFNGCDALYEWYIDRFGEPGVETPGDFDDFPDDSEFDSLNFDDDDFL